MATKEIVIAEAGPNREAQAFVSFDDVTGDVTGLRVVNDSGGDVSVSMKTEAREVKATRPGKSGSFVAAVPPGHHKMEKVGAKMIQKFEFRFEAPEVS